MTPLPVGKSLLRYFIALFLVFILLMGHLLLPFASILVLSGVLSAVLYPVYQILERKMPPTVAALCICMAVFFGVSLAGSIFVGVLSNEVVDAYQFVRDAVLADEIQNWIQSSQMLTRLNTFLSRFDLQIVPEDLVQPVSDLGKVAGMTLVAQVRALASNTLRLLAGFVMTILVCFFLLRDGKKLIAFLVNLSPLPPEQDHMLVARFKAMAGAILVVNGIGGLIQGMAGGVFFSLLGWRSPVLWGAVMGVLAFLPIVGIGAVLFPAAIWMGIQGRFGAMVGILVFYGVMSLGTEYVLKPKLVGDRVAMHPLLVFLAIIGGLQIYGLFGILYGPLLVTGFLTLVEIYHANYQKVMETEERVGPGGLPGTRPKDAECPPVHTENG